MTEVDTTRGSEKKPVCPNCGAALHKSKWFGLFPARCSNAACGDLKGYSGQFEWLEEMSVAVETDRVNSEKGRRYLADQKRSQDHQRLKDAIVDAAMASHAVTVPDFDAMGKCQRRLWEACEALRVGETRE